MGVRAKNHSDELIFHLQGLRRSAANLGIASEKSLREFLLACLRAKRFDMEVSVPELNEAQKMSHRITCGSFFVQ